MQRRFQALFFAFALCAIVGFSSLAYAPGLKGVFVFDSVERIVRNDALKITSLSPERFLGAAYAGHAGYPQRGLAYVSVALNYYFSGQRFDPFAFKLTNLIIHALNGFLVLVLARMIIARWWEHRNPGSRDAPPARIFVLAFFAAGIWTLHPIQLTSVLYVIQRMTSLSATCVLIGAVVFVFARAGVENGRKYSWSLIYANVIIWTGLGFFFKQNALLLPAFIAVLEIFLFDRQRLSSACRRKLLLYFGLTLVLPALVGVLMITGGTDVAGASYESREFNMFQRLLTQARVLFFYLSLLAVPDIRRLGLYHDDFAASTGIADPWTTLVAVLAWIVAAMLVVKGAKNRTPWAFAGAWFLVGHAVESTLLPLELVHEHRNYAPSVAIWIAVAYYAGAVWSSRGRLGNLIPAIMVAWLLALTFVTHSRANAWRNPAVLMEALSRHHPQSYRAASGYAFNSVPTNADLSIRFDAHRRAGSLESGAVSPLIEMAKLATVLEYIMVGQGQAAPPAGDETPEMTIAEMALRLDRRHNARVLSSLDDKISRRLAYERPRTGNIVALVSLVDCSLDGRRECINLREAATRWHTSALSNGNLPTHHRAVLELSVAKLYVLSGDHDEAVGHAKLAGRSAGNNLFYRLQEATLYSLLGRWLELGDALDDIEVRFPVRTSTDSTYQDLRKQHDVHTNR